MEVTVQKKNNTAELTVEVSVDEMERYMRRAAKDLARDTDIKGFRKGAAPYEVLERQFGKERILNEAAHLAVRETYVRAVTEHEIEVVGSPAIEIQKIAVGNPLAYKATAPLVPTVELGEYEKIPLEKESVEVTSKEIVASLTTLQRSRASYAHVSRSAQKGDRVEVDFKVTKQGVLIEGGTSTQHPLVIGEGHFMPGFEDELTGMKEGEEKTFTLTAPQDYYHKDIAGSELTFAVTMRNIQEVTLPELNDAFASGLGKFDSLDALKQSIGAGLAQEKEERAKERRRIAIIEHMIERARMGDLPGVLLDEELEKMEHEFDVSLERMNVDKASYLEHLGTTMEGMRESWAEQAKKRVMSALILRKVAEQESIHVPENEVDERVQRMLQSLPSQEEAEKLNLDAVRDHAHASIRNEKVFELLEERVVDK